VRKVYTRIDTGCPEGFMKYAVEMDSGSITCIINFINIGYAIRNLIRGDIQTALT
jgi:hypothetical protein